MTTIPQFRANVRLALPGGQVIEPGEVFTLEPADLAAGINVDHWLRAGAVEEGPPAEVVDTPADPPRRGRRGDTARPLADPVADDDGAPGPAGWEVTSG